VSEGTLLGLVGSFGASSRTRSVVEAVLAAAAAEGGMTTQVVVLGDHAMAFADGTRAEEQTGGTRAVLEAVEAADGFVLGTPVYRGTQSAMLKNLMDLTPRGVYDGAARPFQAKPVVVAATAAVPHHFLGLDGPSEILRGFFAAWVVPPGVFASHDDFGPDGGLASAPVRQQAERAGRALAAMHRALAGEPALRAVEPAL
jgi:FMN reductase